MACRALGRFVFFDLCLPCSKTLNCCFSSQVQQEAGLQPLGRRQRLAVVARPEVRGDRVLRPPQPQLREDSASRWRWNTWTARLSVSERPTHPPLLLYRPLSVSHNAPLQVVYSGWSLTWQHIPSCIALTLTTSVEEALFLLS